MTSFPSGTLHSLRALLAGGAVIFLVGLADDMRRPGGLDWKTKMAAQVVAAGLLVAFGIRIHFIQPAYVAISLDHGMGRRHLRTPSTSSTSWTGSRASQAAVAALAFLIIALPSEEVYVNLCASALPGAAWASCPGTSRRSGKIFMGDSGSLFLGFILAGLSLGTRLLQAEPLGVFAPLFILLVPIFDTFFVGGHAPAQGPLAFHGLQGPFRPAHGGDGLQPATRSSRSAAAAAGILAFCAFLVTQVTLPWALCVYVVVAGLRRRGLGLASVAHAWTAR